MEKNGNIIIVGAGPAGLMAAEVLAKAGCCVSIYEKKPSPARKFLMAGRGGLNITHSEDIEKFMGRYGGASAFLRPMIDDFTPSDLRQWCEGLGEETFVGSSGRVFPKSFKASPLLRAWLKRLSDLGVTLHLQTMWQGWGQDGSLLFLNKDGAKMRVQADAVLLALGGASWPGLGTDGSWVALLRDKDVPVVDLCPANCGFVCAWSDVFREKFSGVPLKAISLSHAGNSARGDLMINEAGIEGGAVYALSSSIRNAIQKDGRAELRIDLRPDMARDDIAKKLEVRKAAQSFSNYLKSALSLPPVQISLLRETVPDVAVMPSDQIADLIKSVALTVNAPFSIERAISSAGGITLTALNDDLMIKSLPGVFAAGEMLDWEAPTGGYLLQASFATGVRAAHGILRYLGR